jgi:hypothetical protein
MRCVRLLALLVGAVLPGCGGDPFGVEDAIGVWEVRSINGLELTGTAPVGVWIRESGGSDSTIVAIQSILLEFASDSTSCVWQTYDGIHGAETEDDCAYSISPDGDIAVDVGGRALEGTAEGQVMTLRDDATNEHVFEKRT